MREIAEFRISEEYASRFLANDCGKKLEILPGMPFVRKIITPTDSALFHKIISLDKRLGKKLFLGWDIWRTYGKRELQRARLFLLRMTGVFEPAGEECGSVYDDSVGCSRCGGEAPLVSELFLDLRKAPRKKDMARTIANEWIVSQRLAELIVAHKVAGCELRPAIHKAYHKDAPMDFSKVPTGRELHKRAEQAGCPPGSWKYCVWLNKPEQRELLDQASKEYEVMLDRRLRNRKPPPPWYHLVVTSPRVKVAIPPTRFGTHVYDEDPKGENRCPLAPQPGHVVNLGLLSEVSVVEHTWDGSDISCTEQLVGVRRGLLRPHPMILISPRFYRLLTDSGIRGYKVEVAYFG